MIKEAFLICALSLPVSMATGGGGSDSPNREAFIKEWDWLHAILDRMHPDHEFMIMPIKEGTNVPKGWTLVKFEWRGHVIYKREKQSA